MKRLVYMMGAMLILQSNVAAQSKTKIKVNSINQVGLLAGGSTNSLGWQSVNGISFGTFSVGAGVGMDYYHFKTIPLFADVRKNLWDRKQTPFMYLDIGTNLPSDRFVSESQWHKSTYGEGLFYDIGIGYKWTLTGRLGLNLAFGYSQKNINETQKVAYWSWPILGTISEENWNTSYFKYSFRRLGFKAGLSF